MTLSDPVCKIDGVMIMDLKTRIAYHEAWENHVEIHENLDRLMHYACSTLDAMASWYRNSEND